MYKHNKFTDISIQVLSNTKDIQLHLLTAGMVNHVMKTERQRLQLVHIRLVQ